MPLPEFHGDVEAVTLQVRRLFADGTLEALFPGFNLLDGCTQPVAYHAEGDALAHTTLVMANAAQATGFTSEERAVLMAAAGVHDIDKPTTRVEDPKTGDISFVKHAELAAARCADFAATLGFTPEQAEALTYIVRHHMDAHTLMSMRPHGRKEFYTSKHFRLLNALQKADALASRNPDGGHAEVLEAKFAQDQSEMAAADEFAANDKVFKGRVKAYLQSKSVPMGPRISAATNAARVALGVTPEDAALTQFLDGWLAQ